MITNKCRNRSASICCSTFGAMAEIGESERRNLDIEYDSETRRQGSSRWEAKARMFKSQLKAMSIVSFLHICGIVHSEYVPECQIVIRKFNVGVLDRLRTFTNVCCTFITRWTLSRLLCKSFW